MLDQRKLNAYLLLSIVASNCLLLTYAYPQQEVYQLQQQQQQQQQLSQPQSPVYRPESSGRKFAVKPNASKKVALDDIEDDIEGNQIQESVGGPGGFTWSNMLSTVMTMFFNGAANAPTKSDDVDGAIGLGGSPWANVISMGKWSRVIQPKWRSNYNLCFTLGLRIINTLLGGGAPSDGIDKVDNGGSPMQVICPNLSFIIPRSLSFAFVPFVIELCYRTYCNYTHMVIGLLSHALCSLVFMLF